MLGRCQQTLVRGLIAGLQQHQQCLQLEVLGTLQIVRHVNDWRSATRPTDRRRRNVALEKALERINPVPSISSIYDDTPSNTSTTSQSAPSAGDTATSTSSSSSSTVAGPLSDAIPDASSSRSKMVSSAPDPKNSGWAPDWLNKLMDMPFKKKKPRPPPGATSPLQQDAPLAVDSASSSSKETTATTGDDWPELEGAKDMSLDDYQRMLRDEPGHDEIYAKPRPKKPKGLNNPRALLRDRLDYDRLAHARYSLHYNLISTMSGEDKEVARHNLNSCMKDVEWLTRVAQVGQTRRDVVVDMLRNFERRRDTYQRLAAWRDSGRQMPNKDDMGAVDKVLTTMKNEKERDDLKPILEKRDPASCELHLWRSAWARGPKKHGMFRLCPRTELPYGECCGALRRHH